MIQTDLTRRNFLRIVGVGGTALVLGCAFGDGPETNESALADWEPNAFVKIDDKGIVTVTIPKSDMGQGVRTTLAMIVAEELDADWTKVRVEQASGNAQKYGSQMTGGSQSVRGTYGRLRQAGATARALLVGAAAAKWNVNPETLTTAGGIVTNPATRAKLAYGALVQDASKLTLPSNVNLKNRADFKIMGKATKRLDTPDIVTGKAVYAQDKKVAGAAYAVIVRRPAYGATIKSIDDSAARKVSGVLDVVQSGSLVAVLATNTWAAMKGRDALKVEWDLGPNADLDTAELKRRMRGVLKPFAEGIGAGGTLVSASYEFPYLAHCTMEPQNAVADVRDSGCEVWAPTQGADSTQNQVARRLGVSADAVKVTPTLLGGGFGRRLAADFAGEAVDVSKLAKRPIKLVWTREDDMRNDNYRPMALHSFVGAVDVSGNPVAWHQQIVESRGSSNMSEFGNGRLPYSIPEIRVAQGSAASPVPIGAWRSVEHTHTIPAMECFIDEMAVAAKKDPYEFRRGLLQNARLKRVLEIVAQRSGWGKKLPAGEGMGISCFGGYGSYAAHVIHVSVQNGQVKVKKVFAAVDCGLAINPLGVQAQMEGACCDALATALHAEITLEKGGIVQSNFNDFEWLRYNETPEFDIAIEVTDNEPGGMGEVGYPGVMPALANAVFAATGKRVRKWPLRMNELV